MSENENEQGAPAASAGAFTKDKKFGNRLDQVVALHEPFLLLGGVPDEPVETKFGMSDSVKVLLQKINPETGAPQGPPIKATTVASAIVEKVLALTDEEKAAGPVVQLQHVQSKGRGGQTALVMSWIRNLADADDFSEFGLDPAAVSKVTELALPEGQRIPY